MPEPTKPDRLVLLRPEKRGLLVMPAIYLAWLLYVNDVRGPNYIMVPNDISFVYLLNAVNLLSGHAPGTLIHPALTVMYFLAAITWGTYRLFGNDPLAADVVSRPDFYFSIFVSCIIALMTLSHYVMGLLVYRGLKNLRLTMLVQSIPIVPPVVEFTWNNYGSPESFVMLFAMLLVGLTTAQLGVTSDNPSRSDRFSVCAAILCGLAVISKFIALPLVALPFLASSGWRARARFSLALLVVLIVVLAPIYLSEANILRLTQDIENITTSAARERAAAAATQHGEGLLSALWAQAAAIARLDKMATTFLAAGIVALAAMGAVRKFSPPTVKTPAYRIAMAALTTGMSGFVFTMLRPKPQYFVVYFLVFGMGFALTIAVFALLLKSDLSKILSPIGSAIGAMCFLGLLVFNFTDEKNGIPFLSAVVNDATILNQKFLNAPSESVAVITAIQASSIPTALDHSNQYARLLFAPEIAYQRPPQQFNYIYDGFTVLARNNYPIKIRDLFESREHVYYWSVRKNFSQNEWRVPPLGVFRDVYVGRIERAVEIVAFAIAPPFVSHGNPTANSANGWSTAGCPNELRCIELSIRSHGAARVSHVGLMPEDAQDFAAMPRSFRLEGSDDGRNWLAVAIVEDDAEWKTIAQPNRAGRVYPVADNRAFRHFRLIDVEHRKGLWPGRLILYSTSGCATTAIAIPEAVRMYPGFDGTSAMTTPRPRPALYTQFYESAGPLPLAVELSFPSLTPMTGYRLAASGFGRDSTDRMPTSWDVLGSTDGTTWARLDSRSDEANWSENEERDYSINSQAFVRHVRLVVRRVQEGSIVRIGMLGVVRPNTPRSRCFDKVSRVEPSESRYQ
jgi:hypothetical protein